MQNSTVWLQASELKAKTPTSRLKYAVSQVLSDGGSSGFDKGVALQRMLRYVSNFVGVKSPRVSAGLNLVNRCIDILALDTVVRTQLRVAPQDRPTYDPTERRIQRYGLALCKLGIFALDNVRYDMFSGDYDGEGSFCAMGDAISALLNPVKSALQASGLEIVRAEHLVAESEEADTHLFVLKVCGSTFCLISSTYPKLLSFRADRDSVFFYSAPGGSPSKSNGSRSFGLTLFTALDAFTRANFLAHLNPQKNFIEMASGQSLSIRARLPSVRHVYGLPVDSIEQSIRYALDNDEKRVLAIVGNPGLGKTSAVHNLVNRFPDSPVFFVSPEAFSNGSALAGIRALFKSVSSRKSRAIVVFDDFDGFKVDSKNALVTELLRQFSGNGEFNSVALLVINDPSKVHPTILRDERTDEIYLMGYIDDIKTLRAFFKDTFDISISLKSRAAAFMLENKFSTAALSSTVKYCQARGSKTVDASLLEAARAIKQFQDIANLQCVRGKLTAASFLPELVESCTKEEVCTELEEAPLDCCRNSPRKHISGVVGQEFTSGVGIAVPGSCLDDVPHNTYLGQTTQEIRRA